MFKHYISGTWRVGRNFLNPLYEDSKASCNIYFDRRSNSYKLKDFGSDSYSGDCFFFVGRLKGLDCNNSVPADVAEEKGVTVRKEAGDRNYWMVNLYICKHTNCPAVLVENFFQDNKEDVDFLLSEKGKQCVTDIMVEGIKRYLANK